jgi:hypothetical protein
MLPAAICIRAPTRCPPLSRHNQKYRRASRVLNTDKLKSHAAASNELGLHFAALPAQGLEHSG